MSNNNYDSSERVYSRFINEYSSTAELQAQGYSNPSPNI